MRLYVFDTGDISLLYDRDPRLRQIVENLDSHSSDGMLSSVTLAEFFYKTCQRLGRDTASLWSRQVSERMTVATAGAELSKAAGLEKCRNSQLSIADAFALALARSVHGTLLTSDSELSRQKDVNVRYFPV